jgi:hypothetical protein
LPGENRANEPERPECNETIDVGSHCPSLTTDKTAR